VPDAAALSADRALFRSVIANLLRNAAEYTPAGGRVEVGWQNDARELTVRNSTQDFSAEDVPHLFERLWRKDKSRTGNEHCGLGLALSREFARLMDLNLTAQLDGKGELVFVVSPRARSDLAIGGR
jgi:signal transduction histidine kinase